MSHAITITKEDKMIVPSSTAGGVVIFPFSSSNNANSHTDVDNNHEQQAPQLTLKQRIQLRKRSSMELTASTILASHFSTQPPPPTTGTTEGATMGTTTSSGDAASGASVDVDGVATAATIAVAMDGTTTNNNLYADGGGGKGVTTPRISNKLPITAAAVVAAVSTIANITASSSSSLMQQSRRRRAMVCERMLVSFNSDEHGSLKLNESGSNMIVAATTTCTIPRTVTGASMGTTTTTISSTTPPRPPGRMSFLQKLLTALSDSRYTPHILSWLDDIHHGQGFTIHSKTQFATQVMPTYFSNRSSRGVAKYTSFTRKLNRWGFVRVKRGLEIGCYYYYTAGGDGGEDATTTSMEVEEGGGGGGGQRKFYRGMSMESCGELRPLLIVGTGNTNTNDSNNKKDKKSSEDTVHDVKKMVSDMKARTKKEDKKRKRRISNVGDNHGKGSTRGGDVHNNDGLLIEEGEEQQLSHHQSSLINVWRPQQLVGHQQQHQSKGESTLKVLGNECGTIGVEEQLLAAMQIEIQSQISKWDVRMRLYNQLQLELLRRSQQQQHQAQQEVTENVNTPTAAPVTYSADHQQCILANALRVLRARIDMGLLPSSSSMLGLRTTYSSTAAAQRRRLQNNIDEESNTNRSSATSPAATTTTATARTTPPMDNYHVHAKMHTRLHELLDKGHIFDTSVGDVQLNNNNATTATPTMAEEACSNLSQLKRLDSDEDQTNTTTPTKNQQQLAQRMKIFLSTRRESSSTLPPAA